jgi:4-amino-4-deoxy-L-arabinose transferase-like glycosyltransferase
MLYNMKMNKKTIVLLIAIAAALLFIPFLGWAHLFDWDEINFAECSREMLKTGDYLRPYIDFKPFWEKPPLFFWMQSISMYLFGINEFAARLPNAICGIVTLITLFLCGEKLYDKKFGVLWALAYGGSLFPDLYFRSGIIDPWFNLFTFLSLYFFILYHWQRNHFAKDGLLKRPVYYVALAGMFMGLAILTKGPVALILFLLALGVYFIYNRFKIYFSWGYALLFLCIATTVTFTWYGYETIKDGPWFISEFIKYQYRLLTTHDAGQEGFFGYHYIVILIGCFPASILAIPSFFKTSYANRADKDFKIWMLILFWVVTILFTIVQSRIVHYSALAWFPVTFLAAYTLYKWERKEMFYKKYISIFLAIIGGLLALLLLLIALIGLNIKKLAPYVTDSFAKANMETHVSWNGTEGIVGFLMILTIVAGLRLLHRRKYFNSALVFFVGTSIVISLASAIIVPKIEQYSQGAAIEFFIQRQGENCYVHLLGYKSYAQLFYTKKEKPANEKSYDEEWLLTGGIDKPVYFVSKVDRINNYTKYTSLKELYRKNGFVFLKREIPQK